jgi:putative ABC transport system permease protein
VRQSVRALTAVSTVASSLMSLRGVDGAGHVTIGLVSPELFGLLDATPALGRLLSADPVQGAGEIVLSHHGWVRYFAADPAIVGRTIGLDTILGRRIGRDLTVVGVMPAAFTFPRPETTGWTMPAPPAGPSTAVFRGRLLARLAPDVTLDAALAELTPVVRQIRQQGAEVAYELVREQDEVVGPVRPAMLLVAATVGVLLLIACLNVTNLLLARALARARELSVRAALGASRGRLARQALTESALLGLAGGVGGLAVASGALAMFRALAATLPRLDLTTSGPGWGGASFPRVDEVSLDGPVLAFVAGLSIATGLAVGLASAMRAARTDVFGAMRATGVAARSGTAASTARRVLVVAQVASAMTLLVGALLLSRSVQSLLSTDTGYRTDGVTTFQVALPAGAYPDARVQAFAEALTARLRTLPHIDAAAYANQVPMVQLRDTAGGLWTTPDATRTPVPDDADARYVSRDYLAALGIRVVAGRGFEARDGPGQPRVILVNQTLARRRFPDRDPLGAQVYLGRDTTPWTIVGVVADVRQFGLDAAPGPQFFIDLRQWSGGMPLFPAGPYYVVKTARPVASLAAEVRAIVHDLDPDAALFNVTPLAAIVESSVSRPRLYASLVGGFAVVGALLAAIGLYGVLAFLVQERTPEIGVRMALGASRGDVMRMVGRQGGGLVAAGLVPGLAGAVMLARAASALLYGVRPLDPSTYAIAIVAFAGVAAAAIAVPARRASRVDPVTSLRCE